MADLLPINLLYVEDERELREAVALFLEMNCATVQTAADGVEALEKIALNRPDVVVTDIRMPRLDGLGLVARLKNDYPDIPVIISTAFTEVDYLLRAIQLGVSGYVCKPPDYDELIGAIKKCAEPAIQRRQIESLHNLLGDAFLGQLGGSESLLLPARLAARAAENSYSLLIEGEAGTGKTYLAGKIHALGWRSRGPFVVMNGGELSAEQAELELFGRKGRELGRLSVAAAGTILIQQVDKIPLSVQDKLARIIQDKHFYRIGIAEPQPLEARVMATIRGDAVVAHREGRLGEALFYLLSEQVITLPPLRQLPDEIPRLAALFLRESADDLHRSGSHLTGDALPLITGYEWPGNIRQLKNVMRRAALYQGQWINSELLQPLLPAVTDAVAEEHPNVPPSLLFDDMEQWLMCEALNRTGGRKMQAAELLGIDYKRFKRKLEKHGMETS